MDKEKINDLSKSQIEYLIDECIIGKNSSRDKLILKRRLIDGIIFEDLAEEFNLSDRQIKNIVYKNINRLIKHI